MKRIQTWVYQAYVQLLPRWLERMRHKKNTQNVSWGELFLWCFFSCLPILAVQSSCKLWSSLYLESGENKEFIATLLINVVKLNWSKETLVLLDVIIHGFFIHLLSLILLKKGTCMNYIVLETVLEKDHVINGNRQSSWTSIMWKVLLDLQWSRIVSLLWIYFTLRLSDS